MCVVSLAQNARAAICPGITSAEVGNYGCASCDNANGTSGGLLPNKKSYHGAKVHSEAKQDAVFLILYLQHSVKCRLGASLCSYILLHDLLHCSCHC